MILPSNGLELDASTYFVAVVSEGTGAGGRTIGMDPVSVSMIQPGPLPVTDLGEWIVGGERDLTPFSLPRGGMGLFKLTIPEDSLELGLAVGDQTGNLSVHHLTGATEVIPRPAPVSSPEYGVEGGKSGTPVNYTGICQIIGSGTHYFAARALKNAAKEWIPASGKLGMVRCGDLEEMNAGKGFATGSLSKGAWEFRLLEIPDGPDAWELMVESWVFNEAGAVLPGDVSVVIRRNRLPTSVTSSVRESDEVFPPGGTYFVNQQSNWTGLARDVDNVTKISSVLPMGKPIEPGYYVVGIYAKTSLVHWSMASCLLGNDFDVPITDLPFSGEEAVTPPLTAIAKTAHYYKVTVPSNTRSWQLGLDVPRGDWAVAIRHGGLPGSRSKGFQRPEVGHGYLLDKSGSEHLLLLPESEPTTPPAEAEEPWQPYIKEGDYYIALASKGATPSPPRVGAGSSEGSFFSEGPIPVEPIGSVLSTGLSHALAIDGGKNVFVEFTVPEAAPALEIRLDGRAGNPQFALWTGNDNTVPRPPSTTDTYGYLGGEVDPEHRFEASTIHTFTNVWLSVRFAG